jgi:propanol-preferring alcohol dehydrogenase
MESSDDMPQMQKAIVISQSGPSPIVDIQEIPVPSPGIDDVLIRLTHTGVCHGDVSLIYGGWESLGFRADETKVSGPYAGHC